MVQAHYYTVPHYPCSPCTPVPNKIPRPCPGLSARFQRVLSLARHTQASLSFQTVTVPLGETGLPSWHVQWAPCLRDIPLAPQALLWGPSWCTHPR